MQYIHVDNILVIVTSTTQVSILHTTICIHLLQQCLTVYTTISILRYPGAPAKMKPQMVNEYNHYMFGVDRLDQRMAYYQFTRKSVHWWRKVFFWSFSGWLKLW